MKAVAKGRPRATRSGHFYTPQKTRDAEKELRYFIAAAEPPLFQGAIGINIVFTIQRPKSAKGRAYPTVKPDLDNTAKLIYDCGNGLLYADDKQICQLSAMKRYGEKDFITICVFELDQPAINM